MRHSKSLLFIDYQQAQILKLDVSRKQSVRPDQYVYFPSFQFFEDALPFFLRAEAADHPDPDWKRRVPPPKCFVVLKSENGGGSKHRYLLAVVNRLERRPHRDFRFPVAHVSAQ